MPYSTFSFFHWKKIFLFQVYLSAKRSVYFPAPRIVFSIPTASASRFCRFDFWLRKSLNKNLSFFALRGPDTDLDVSPVVVNCFLSRWHDEIWRHSSPVNQMPEVCKWQKRADSSAKPHEISLVISRYLVRVRSYNTVRVPHQVPKRIFLVFCVKAATGNIPPYEDTHTCTVTGTYVVGFSQCDKFRSWRQKIENLFGYPGR